MEEERMKQPSLKEFMEISKKKLSEKEKEAVAEEDLSDWDKNQEDDSREATVRQMFHGICHMKEYIHQEIKKNDEKLKALKRIVKKRMDAIIKLTKAQDSRIRTLENVIKKYSEGDLNEIYEINKQQEKH